MVCPSHLSRSNTNHCRSCHNRYSGKQEPSHFLYGHLFFCVICCLIISRRCTLHWSDQSQKLRYLQMDIPINQAFFPLIKGISLIIILGSVVYDSLTISFEVEPALILIVLVVFNIIKVKAARYPDRFRATGSWCVPILHPRVPK